MPSKLFTAGIKLRVVINTYPLPRDPVLTKTFEKEYSSITNGNENTNQNIYYSASRVELNHVSFVGGIY